MYFAKSQREFLFVRAKCQLRILLAWLFLMFSVYYVGLEYYLSALDL